MKYPYFRGLEADRYSFYRVPKALIKVDLFEKMSGDAKLLYTWMFFKYFVKAWVAIYLVSNTFTITMAVFDVGQSVVNSASGIINGETAIDVSSLSMQMQAAMATMEIGELVVLALETFLVSFCMKIMSVVITVIVYQIPLNPDWKDVAQIVEK